jgi:hypothetical protein
MREEDFTAEVIESIFVIVGRHFRKRKEEERQDGTIAGSRHGSVHQRSSSPPEVVTDLLLHFLGLVVVDGTCRVESTVEWEPLRSICIHGVAQAIVQRGVDIGLAHGTFVAEGQRMRSLNAIPGVFVEIAIGLEHDSRYQWFVALQVVRCCFQNEFELSFSAAKHTIVVSKKGLQLVASQRAARESQIETKMSHNKLCKDRALIRRCALISRSGRGSDRETGVGGLCPGTEWNDCEKGGSLLSLVSPDLTGTVCFVVVAVATAVDACFSSFSRLVANPEYVERDHLISEGRLTAFHLVQVFSLLTQFEHGFGFCRTESQPMRALRQGSQLVLYLRPAITSRMAWRKQHEEKLVGDSNFENRAKAWLEAGLDAKRPAGGSPGPSSAVCSSYDVERLLHARGGRLQRSLSCKPYEASHRYRPAYTVGVLPRGSTPELEGFRTVKCRQLNTLADD